MKELKDLICFGLCSAELVADIADGIGFSVVGKLVSVAKEAGPAMSGAKKALDEYKAMSDEEALELEKFVVESFDISQDNVEVIIESALKWAIELHSIIGMLIPKVEKHA